MTASEPMYDHFSRIASRYRSVRTTDEAPIRIIRDALAWRSRIRAADIGCGAGRYDLLLFRYIPRLELTCVDVNPQMLEQLASMLSRAGITAFETRASSVEDMDLGASSLDAVFTFNAVHHFDFPTFLARAGKAIRPQGRIFVYTRTPEQNAGSVWGRFFPGFLEKETRLFALDTMKDWVEEADGLELSAVETFRFPRSASLERLLAQAESKHYSTFSLYEDGEFEAACTAFAEALGREYAGAEAVEWYDENVMLNIVRTS